MTSILMFNVCVLCVVYGCCRGGGGSYERVGVPALWCLCRGQRPPWVSVRSTVFVSGSLFVCVTGDSLVLL